MVNPLYWISDLSNAVVLIICLLHDMYWSKKNGAKQKSYHRLLLGVIFFCLQDAAWGICAGFNQYGDVPLYICSSIFHTSTALVLWLWLYYILDYLKVEKHLHVVIMAVAFVVVDFQITLVIMNYFNPTIFYIKDGLYYTAHLRPVTFVIQYLVYIAACIITLIVCYKAKGERKKQLVAVFCFALAPVIMGIFQLLYPDGPFNCMGYFLGCFIIHIFVVSREREKLIRIQNDKKIAEQILISNTDVLTGLGNRRAYEDEIAKLEKHPNYTNLVHVSMDLNGLKLLNDSKGHNAGDELIKGSAECIRTCFSPYGSVYRIGGDEFAAIITLEKGKIKELHKLLKETAAAWKGQYVNGISISTGFAGNYDLPGKSIIDISKLSDEKMYKEKSEYYTKMGIDRRGQASIYNVICSSYEKILKINLSNDSFKIISMNENEKNSEKGFSDKISSWLRNFALSGSVAQEDVNEFLADTNMIFLRRYFRENESPLSIIYRRKINNAFRKSKMEIVKAEDYSDINQSLYLYVKDIDK